MEKTDKQIREPPDVAQEQEQKQGFFGRALTWVISFDIGRMIGLVVLPKKYQKWLEPKTFVPFQVGQWWGMVSAAVMVKLAPYLAPITKWVTATAVPLAKDAGELLLKWGDNVVALIRNATT